MAFLPPGLPHAQRGSLASPRASPDHLLAAPQLPEALLGAGVTGLPAFWVQDSGCRRQGLGGEAAGGCGQGAGDLQLPGARGAGGGRKHGPRHLDSGFGSGAERGHACHPEPPSAWRCVAATRRLMCVAHTCGYTDTHVRAPTLEAWTQGSRDVTGRGSGRGCLGGNLRDEGRLRK